MLSNVMIKENKYDDKVLDEAVYIIVCIFEIELTLSGLESIRASSSCIYILITKPFH